MEIEEVKKALAHHRATQGRREIPEKIWNDVVSLAQSRGAGAVGKLLGLNSVRIRFWAKKFNIEIPSRVRRQSISESHLVRVAEVKIQNPEVMRISEENKKILEISGQSGLKLSLFEAGTEKHFQAMLRMLEGEK